MEVILASASPRRQQLLSKLVHHFDIIPSTIDEKIIKDTENIPAELVKKLSSEKAFDVFHKKYQKNDKEFTVIGSDTVVYFNGIVLGKPADRSNAVSMLSALQNKSNDVYTGTTIIIKKEHSIIVETFYTKSTVYFKPMSYNDIQNYVNTKEPLDKAGAYAIQGEGQKYLRGFEGDYHAIVGLDIKKIANIFQKYQLLP